MAKAAGTQAQFEVLQSKIKKQQFDAVYYLYGEEEYFIDKLAENLEQEVLAGSDPSFNLDTLYGPETSSGQIIGLVRSYPLFAPYRLIVVKEAQKLRKDEREKLGDFLTNYLERPNPQSVLVLVNKEKSGPDKRTKLGKTLASKACLFESKPLYENQVPKWLTDYLTALGLSIEPAAVQVIVASLGTDLKLIENELSKVRIQLESTGNKHIDRSQVFDLINIDKEFNVFELLNHIGEQNVLSAHVTLDYMLRNGKGNHPVVILGQLLGYFVKLGICKSERAENEKDIASILGIHEFIAKGYALALRNYTLDAILHSVAALAKADLALKGASGGRMDDAHKLKMLLYDIMQRPNVTAA